MFPFLAVQSKDGVNFMGILLNVNPYRITVFRLLYRDRKIRKIGIKNSQNLPKFDKESVY